MKVCSIFRSVIGFMILTTGLSLAGIAVFAQDIGVDVGGAAGIFRPKNPEARKRNKPAPTRRGTPAHTTTNVGGNAEDRIEDLLDKGNQLRDSRRFAEAEAAYQSIFKIKPQDGRAAYGLGNIFSD